MAPANSTNDPCDDSAEAPSNAVREEPAAYGLVLPVDPTFRSLPPAGTWEDGYRLSRAALALVKDRPEIFAQRSARMCDVEFRI